MAFKKKFIRKPVQGRALDTYESILTATTKVLDQEGIEGVNTNRIAEKAGIGIASLYQYFRNKNQIIDLLMKKIVEKKLDTVKLRLQEFKTSSLEEAVSEVIHALVESKLANSRVERIMESQVPQVDAFKIMEKFDAALMSLFIEFLEPFQKELKNEDLEFSVFIIIQAVKGVLMMTNYSRPEYLRSKKFENLLSKMVLSGLKP